MMSRIRRPIAKSVWLLAIAAWTLCGAVLPASGLERQAVLGMFDEITATTNSGLETWVNDGKESYVTVGDPVVMHFRSDRDAYLTVVYLDADGTATVIYPSADPEAAHIRADQGLRFPSSGGAFELSAQPPLGYETIFALSTPEPMTLERLGLSARDSANGVELERVGDLVQRLKSIASELGEGVAAARFDHRVRAGGDDAIHHARDRRTLYGTHAIDPTSQARSGYQVSVWLRNADARGRSRSRRGRTRVARSASHQQ